MVGETELRAMLAASWYRVLAIPAPVRVSSPESDFAAVLPAALSAAQRRRPFVAGWLSRGGGMPLELITNAGPLVFPAGLDGLTTETGPQPGRHAAPRQQPYSGQAQPGQAQPGPDPASPSVPQPRPYSGTRPAPLAWPRSAAGAVPQPWAQPAPDSAAEPARQAPPHTPHAARETAVEPAHQAAQGHGDSAAEPAQTGMLFPAGARGVPIGDDWLADAGRLCWTPCPGRQAPPLARDDGRDFPAGAAQPTLFESTLVTLMDRPFGWFIVAEPADLLDAEVAELRTQLTAIRRFDEERARLDVERAERRIQELDAFREAGLWRVRVLVGAATPAELRRVAPVLVGSADLGRHPYRLRSGLEACNLEDALAVEVAGAGDHAQVPFTATAGALAALAGLPRREVPGLRLLDSGYFDVTSETDGRAQPDRPAGGQQPAAAKTIALGAILDGQDRAVGTFRVPLATLNRHVFVTGATGAGKSQTVRHLLERLTRANLPWLAIEPAKSEYAAMAGRVEGIGQVTVINPSDPQAIPLSVNPLAPEPGYPVQAHIDMVRALFQAAFDAEEPFPQIMSQALQRVYEANGWDVVTGGGLPGALAAPAVPTLEQLQHTALQVIEDVGYGKELQADVRGFVDVRLRSLRIGSAGRFFEGGHPAGIGELLRGNVVLAIEDVANDEDKAFLMGTLIIRIVEHLRLGARSRKAEGLRHVIVIEEAHRLLRNRGQERASSHAVELFAGMLAEIRAYGEGIIVAEQIPAKLVPDVVKNTALKIVHRLPAQDDRQLVGAAMNLDDEQSRQVVSLEPGIAAVFADGMDRPLRVRVPLGEQRERALDGPAPPIAGRRSAACGRRCRHDRACSLLELRTAELMAAAPAGAWLRIWVETLVLAFVTGHPLPSAPEPVRRWWAGFDSDERLRECVLATVIDRAVASRAVSLRDSYEPERLTRSVADTAGRILGDGGDAAVDAPAGTRAGAAWVIPQLRWVHEVEQALAVPGRYDQAPELTYDLPGVTDRPGVTADDRLAELERHPLSAELERNQRAGWTAVAGQDKHEAFFADLATALVGAGSYARPGEAAAIMDAEWLIDVLSWPGRFMAGVADRGADEDGRGPAGPAAAEFPAVAATAPRVKRGMLSARPPGARPRRRTNRDVR